jgi:hypothetical protein
MMNLQNLIDSGTAWRLEGSVGRAAMAALEAGECVLGPRPVRDTYGNLVPAWWMVAPGSLGSPESAGIDRATLDEPSDAEQRELCAAVGVEVS